MATKERTQEEIRQETLAESISSTEQFYQDHKKTIWGCVAAVAVVVLAVICYVKFIYQPACVEAVNQTYAAEQAFQSGEYTLAYEGDETMLGFKDICSNYGSKAGKAVYFYAAICAYRSELYTEALSYIGKYSTSDPILGSRALALKGDCLVALGDYSKAATLFEKAAKKADSNFASSYLLKAGITYEALGNNQKALKAYELIKDQYAQSIEGYDIDKYIERVK